MQPGQTEPGGTSTCGVLQEDTAGADYLHLTKQKSGGWHWLLSAEAGKPQRCHHGSAHGGKDVFINIKYSIKAQFIINDKPIAQMLVPWV